MKVVGLVLLIGSLASCTAPISQQFSKLPTPTVTLLQSIPSIVRGGTVFEVKFESSATSVLGVKVQVVEYSTDGGATMIHIADLPAGATEFLWTVPVIDARKVFLRVRAIDKLDYFSTADSPVFEVRSTSPTLTQDIAPSRVVSSASSLSYGGDCQSGFDVEIFKKQGPSSFVRISEVTCDSDRWFYAAVQNSDAENSFLFSETDIVGNHSEVAAVWIRDTVPPTITQLQPATETNQNQAAFSGQCQAALTIAVRLAGSPDVNISCPADGNWNYMAHAATDGVRDYSFRQVDEAGNLGTASGRWARDTVAPVFTQDVAPAISASNATTLSIGGVCERDRAIFRSPATLLFDCPANGQWSYIFDPGADGLYAIDLFQKDIAGNQTPVSVTWRRDIGLPVIQNGSLKVAGGVASTNINYVGVDLDASDSGTNITKFCLRYAVGDEIPTPSVECWVAVNNPEQPNLPLQKTLALRQFLFRLGYTPGTYRIFAFVQDEVGNISASKNVSIQYSPGRPPVLVNVMASKSDAPALPLSLSEMTINQGQSVYLRWNAASGSTALKSGPITLYYTLDDLNYTEIAANVSNGLNGSCSLLSGFSTGCYVWNSPVPSGSYFRVRVAVTDTNGMITMAASNFINSAGLSSLAGNTDSGIGASAPSAMFINYRATSYIYPDPGTLAVSKDGKIFFRDYRRGLLYVTPTDGVVRLLLPLSETVANSYEGPVPNAAGTVRRITKIALDYQNGLLLIDYDRIRRIDLGTMRISTVIGSGQSDSDGVTSKSVRIAPLFSAAHPAQNLVLIPLPNGDVFFKSDAYESPSGRLRVFHQNTGLVDSIYVSGNGHAARPEEAGAVTEDLTLCSANVLGVDYPCNKSTWGIEFNPVSSVMTTLHVSLSHAVVGNTHYPLANLEPSGPNIGRSMAPHPPMEGSVHGSHFRVTGRDGRMYSVNREMGRISRFNKAMNSWDKLVGTTTTGTCVDGTDALSCAIEPTDVFVDGQGNLFFIDRGRIRTVDGTQKVVTVYGQSFYFGDGGQATSARFNNVPVLDRIGDNRIVLIDKAEARLREFAPGGTISTLAGNGATLTLPNFTDPAANQPYTISGAGSESPIFSVNPSSGDVYTTLGRFNVVKLDRASGLWVKISDSLRLQFLDYIPNILGFDGTNLLVHITAFDPGQNKEVDSRLTLVSTSGTLTPLTGSRDVVATEICPDGTSVASCSLPCSRHVELAKASYDSVGSQWLIMKTGTSTIKALGTAPGSVVNTLATLNKPATSFVHYHGGAADMIYYCGTDGRLYQRNLATSTEAALEWKVNSIACTGLGLIYKPSTQSLIFPYNQSGMFGVGEYLINH